MEQEEIEIVDSIIYNIVDWFCEENNIYRTEFNKKNDIDKIKFMKILFFAAAVREKESYILSKFSNFQAFHYGPKEIKISEYINSENKKFEFKGNSLILSEDFINKISINEGVNDDFKELKKRNIKLINLPAFDLVDLSVKFSSYRIAHSIAKSKNINSYPMNKNSIFSDVKFFN